VRYAALAMPLLAWLLPVVPVQIRARAKQVAAAALTTRAEQLGQPDRAPPVEQADRSGRFLRGRHTLCAVCVSMKTVKDLRTAGAAYSVGAGKSSLRTADTGAQPERQRIASPRLQMASGLRHELEPALRWLGP